MTPIGRSHPLAELVDLAAEHVEGFERPTKPHSTCGGEGAEPLGRHHSRTCECQFSAWKQGSGTEWDNSPEAVIAAVVLHAAKTDLDLRVNGLHVGVGSLVHGAGVKVDEPSLGTVSEALLMSLLGSYRIDVDDLMMKRRMARLQERRARTPG